MPLRNLAVAAAALLVVAFPAAANDSAYTRIEAANCVAIGPSDPLGGMQHCAGYRGYAVTISEGDLRQSAFFGHLGPWFDGSAFESFGPFNRMADRVEWRLTEDGVPVAAIARWIIENVDPETGAIAADRRGELLVISRVGQPGDAMGCVVGYVDALANKDANTLARKVADEEAHDFACGYAEPMYHGVRGDRAAEPLRSYPAPVE